MPGCDRKPSYLIDVLRYHSNPRRLVVVALCQPHLPPWIFSDRDFPSDLKETKRSAPDKNRFQAKLRSIRSGLEYVVTIPIGVVRVNNLQRLVGHVLVFRIEGIAEPRNIPLDGKDMR
jgi:hypothetical protein